ncbi:MAG: hypothetical protein M3218_05095 [Thermoproteota archaeon]|nr:hypothetical protein [Thermoproteota archaeon]
MLNLVFFDTGMSTITPMFAPATVAVGKVFQVVPPSTVYCNSALVSAV